MNKLLYIILLFVFSLSQVQGQKNALIPKVIKANSNSDLLEQLSSDYNHSLFSVSDTNIVKTMQNWVHLLTAIELYSKEIDFDLKGIKMWLKIFWSKDGKIDYISYYLSGKSINIDTLDFEAFLRSFMRNYQLPVTHKHRFSYDSRVMFPLSLMR